MELLPKTEQHKSASEQLQSITAILNKVNTDPDHPMTEAEKTEVRDHTLALIDNLRNIVASAYVTKAEQGVIACGDREKGRKHD